MQATDLARPKELALQSTMCQRILDSRRWIAQEKLDGWRAMWDGRRMWSRHGKKIETTGRLPERAVIDGELVGGKYVAFDLLCLDGEDLRVQPLSARWMRLSQLGIPTVKTVTNCIRANYEHWIRNGAEGMVLKRLGDPYPPAGGAVWFKVKP